MEQSIFQIPAIDIHSHLGPVHGPMTMEAAENGSEAYLLRTMDAAKIQISVNSSRYAIMPRGSGCSAEGNRQMLEAAHRLPGVYMRADVDPHEPETFAQACTMLEDARVLGIKIHPAEHEYDLEQYGDSIFSFAEALGVPVLGHSGEKGCMPEVYAAFAEQYPTVPIIAAHLGSGPDGDPAHHIRAIRACRTENLYTDTSSAMSLLSGLLEYAVGEIGTEHILFGTDSGLYFSPSQRIRVDLAALSYEEKYRILRGNAVRLFGSRLCRGEDGKGEEIT